MEDMKLAILHARYAYHVTKVEETTRKIVEQEKRKSEQAKARATYLSEKREKKKTRSWNQQACKIKN
jgi:hypothetical protein